jgi:hypothetical protein
MLLLLLLRVHGKVADCAAGPSDTENVHAQALCLPRRFSIITLLLLLLPVQMC